MHGKEDRQEVVLGYRHHEVKKDKAEGLWELVGGSSEGGGSS